ncbi:MAG: hypothetical protein WB810_01590, partial [Candidatus Cybelea sp.]
MPIAAFSALAVFGAPGGAGWKPDPPLPAASKPAMVPAKRVFVNECFMDYVLPMRRVTIVG